jgi:RHS repeat-associated protein
LPENDIFYFHPDHLGSTSYITSRNGSISQHVEYIAFGEVLFEEHSASFSSPYLFNGKELDRETNLSYYGARYLDMKTSLWLNVDPLILKDDFFEENEDDLDSTVFNPRNLSSYAYCYQSPVKLKDPDGENPILGAILGATVDYGIQVASNYANGARGADAFTKNINVSSIVLAGVEGGLTSGASIVRKLAVKSAVIVANNIVEGKTNAKSGEFEFSVETNVKNIYKNIAIDAATEVIGGKIGKYAGGKASKIIDINSGAIAKNTKKVLRSVNIKITRNLNNTIKQSARGLKAFAPKVNNQFQESVKNVFKTKTLEPINKLKENTNEK